MRLYKTQYEWSIDRELLLLVCTGNDIVNGCGRERDERVKRANTSVCCLLSVILRERAGTNPAAAGRSDITI